MRPTLVLSTAFLLAVAGCARAPAETATAASAPLPSAATAPSADALVARGEYIARIGGCNDCHTPGYPESGGQVPREQWLVGTGFGWNGPWGTTYPANLRLKAQEMDETGWLAYTADLHTRPPMPDFAVRGMTEQDRRALYALLRALGPAGAPAPAYLPPGTQPPLPYAQWMLPPPPAEGQATGQL